MDKKKKILFLFFALGVIFVYSSFRNPVSNLDDQKTQFSKKNSSIKNDLPVKKVIDKQRKLSTKDSSFKEQSSPTESPHTESPYWQEKLEESLSRFQNANTEVFIETENKSLASFQNNKPFIKQVLITYRHHDGRENSFRALVDTRNRQILQTWDRSIVETRKPIGFKIP